ncbi:MAG: dynamin family protein [Anaerolineae bacterium]|nr:dynamin family protein [Anaerolineae bacterium]
MKILSSDQEVLLAGERRLLNELLVALVEFPAAPEDRQALLDSIAQLDDLFLLVIVGEYNGGKSAFINALLGGAFLTEGVTPTTAQINILRYGDSQSRKLENENQLLLTLPVELLKEISIVDTPGTNAIIRTHETITTDFIPRSDLVLFVTSADRPFTESERLFMERIRNWGKKILVVVNKIDILQSEQEILQVLEFVNENSRLLLGVSPEIFPISARQALASKSGKPELWTESRFEPLEDYIRNTLDETSRVQIKLLNPLGVGLHIADRYLTIVTNRLETLQDDVEMLADVEKQMALYKEDMQRDFKYRMADIENLLYEMEKRGLDYFEDTFRLKRVFDLLSKERIQTEFENKVIADMPTQIDNKVNDLVDWLVESDLRQWQAVNEHLAERRRAHQGRIVGDLGPGSFEYDRERFMDAVGRQAQQVIDTYDKVDEARQIAEGAQEAVAASAVLEVGAIGLGALVAVLASTAAADVTGILLATFIAALGLVIIPARRKLAKNELSAKLRELRDRLIETLESQFQKEIDRSAQRIDNATAPYTRFVRAEQHNLTEYQDKLQDFKLKLARLKDEITAPESP